MDFSHAAIPLVANGDQLAPPATDMKILVQVPGDFFVVHLFRAGPVQGLEPLFQFLPVFLITQPSLSAFAMPHFCSGEKLSIVKELLDVVLFGN